MITAWSVLLSDGWGPAVVGFFRPEVVLPRWCEELDDGSRDDTWDFTANNFFELPGGANARLGFIYYAARDVPQGRQRARSSLDVAATWPVIEDRAEIAFTFTDVLNDFAVRTDVHGQGFTALYENCLETQVATIQLRLRY